MSPESDGEFRSGLIFGLTRPSSWESITTCHCNMA
jgi:hypothetical protein